MDFLSLHFSALLCGACFFTVYTVWHGSAARWANWFPFVKKILKGLLVGVTVVLSFWAAGVLLGAGTHTGTAVLAFTLGLAAPQLLLLRKAANAKAEDADAIPGLATAAAVARKVGATKARTHLELGGVPVPVSNELNSFFVVGGGEAEKPAVIGTILESLRSRGDTAIVLDAGGALLAKHFKPDTDFVFNPYDNRSVSWSPVAEVQDGSDVLALARSIVPDSLDTTHEPTIDAQAFIAAIVRRLVESRRVKLQDLLYYVQVASKAELTPLLTGTPAGKLLTDERAFAAAKAVAVARLRTYDSLPLDQQPFSVAEMIRAEHSGVLFLTYRDDHLDSLRNLMACLMDVAARTVLSLEPSADRRIWLIVDDVAALGKVQSLELMATKARKSGGCLVLGTSSLSQLVEQYGEHTAETLLSGLGNQIVLRCADTDTAGYLAHAVGEFENKRPAKTNKASQAVPSPEALREQLSGQIQTLADLRALVKLAGDFPLYAAKLTMPPQSEKVRQPFTARDFRFRPMLTLSAPSAAEPAAAPTKARETFDLSSQPGQARPRIKLPTPSHAEEPAKAGPIPSAFNSARAVTKPVLAMPTPLDVKVVETREAPAKAVSRTEATVVPKLKPTSMPDMMPEPQPEPRLQPSPESKPESEPQPSLELNRESKPQLSPEPNLEPEPQPSPEPNLEPETERSPESNREPEPETSPQPKLSAVEQVVTPDVVMTADKLADARTTKPAQQDSAQSEPKTPVIETLSSRRRTDDTKRNARKPQASAAGPVKETQVPAAASSRGSAKDLRSLLS